MRRIIIFAVLVVATLAVGTGVAVADVNNESSGPQGSDGCKAIDEEVYLCSASLENGTATLELYADSRESVLIYDAGGFFKGGEIEQRTHVLDPGDRTTLELPVTVLENGQAGVGIKTDRTVYGQELQEADPRTMLPGEASTSDIWVATATTVSIFVVAVPISYFGARRMRGVIRRVF